MKKLFGILVILAALLLGVLAGCRCSGVIISPTPVVEPSPTEVIEPAPTEEIEEPTPTPVPPTPVPPTPTPEPTPVPPTPTPEPMRYIGLPPAEVQRLREQCLQENPDSLCLPLPLDPTQPGVEVIPVHAAPIELSDGRVIEAATIVFRAPVETVFVAPVSGNIWYRSFESLGLENFRWPTLTFDGGKTLRFNFPLTFHLTRDELPSGLTESQLTDGVMMRGSISVGERILTIKRPGAIETGDANPWLDKFEQPVKDFQVELWLMVPKPDGGTVYSPITEDDLLSDDQGRFVFVLP